MAQGALRLASHCYVSYAKCNVLIAEDESSAGFAYVERIADIGSRVQIGFIYCKEGITSIGEGAQIWARALPSWRRNTEFEEFKLGARSIRMGMELGISSSGLVANRLDNIQGKLFTDLLDSELFDTISNLTQLSLTLPRGEQ